MAVGRTLRPLYVTAGGLLLAGALAFGAVSMCVRGAPVVVPPDYGVPPAVTAPAPSPGSGLEGVVTSTPAPTATVPASPVPVGEPTPPAATAPAKPTYTPPPATPPATGTPPPATPPPTQQPSTVTPIPPTATPVASFTQEQLLRQKLSGLEEILRTEEPTLDSEGKDYKGYRKQVSDVLEAGYFLTTGRLMQNDNIELLPLVQKDFDAFIDKLPYAEATKTRMKETFLGFAYGVTDLRTGRDKYVLVVRGDFPTRSVFSVASNEAGKALAEILNPKMNYSNLEASALAEARSTAFEVAFLRSLEDFTGKSLSAYSSNSENLEYINERVAYFQRVLSNGLTLKDFPVTGIILHWADAQKRGMLKEGQHVNGKDSYSLFLSTMMDDADAKSYVTQLLKDVDSSLDFIRQNALSRLIPNYPLEQQGPISIENAVLRP